ncbi:retrovirus-related Pol polyprotein from type-1 retrotransposable element R2 [Trichonephila clavata]|uniref:Retrovirus-related Pol polyprotein from type-1 retrotransposable element R2 n=1 Tax=Trichonephila clavata TaxID=2740835 RepID=A0A8X6GXN4_TRICU|nr:retrovirus-related Pol polyprotein from type-1 retrotransposable element R2 [Trichonephila clavata]
MVQPEKLVHFPPLVQYYANSSTHEPHRPTCPSSFAIPLVLEYVHYKLQLILTGLLDCTWQSLQRINLSVNPAKCASFHLAGSTPVGSRPSPFTIGDCNIKILGDGDFVNYLGKPVGFQMSKDCSSINNAVSNAIKISASKLSPWQKLDAIKSFFFPSLNLPCALRNSLKVIGSRFSNRQLRKLRISCRYQPTHQFLTCMGIASRVVVEFLKQPGL